jgi:endonuclease/exonuclease/phosphatase family metal-dependent hydrolase
MMRKALSIFTLFALLAVGITTASAQKLRVMSYNVKNGCGIDEIKSIDRCSKVIINANPDVVAIQELDSCTRRNNYYVLGKMAEQTGYHGYFGKAITYKGGSYGVGVLSKERALSVKTYPLPNEHEARVLLVV